MRARASQSTNNSSSGTFWKKIRKRTEFAAWKTAAAGKSTRRAVLENSTSGNANSRASPAQASALQASGCRATAYPHDAPGSATRAWFKASRCPRTFSAEAHDQPVVKSFDQPAKR